MDNQVQQPIIRSISTEPVTFVDKPATPEIPAVPEVPADEANGIAAVPAIPAVPAQPAETHVEYMVEAEFTHLGHELNHRFFVRDYTDKNLILSRLQEEFEKYKQDVEAAQQQAAQKLPDDVASLITPKSN